MKSLVPFLFLFLVMITFNACKKNADTAPAFTSSMSYKVDGVLKTMRVVSAMNNASFEIGGYNDNESMLMQLFFPPNATGGTPSQNVKTGSYDLENHLSYSLNVSYLTKPLEIVYPITQGSVNITYKTNSRIKGTFSFTFLNVYSDTEIVITEGVFDCEINNEYYKFLR